MAFNPFVTFQKNKRLWMAAILLICMASFVFCTGMRGGLEERIPGLFGKSGPPVIEIDGRNISRQDLDQLRMQRNFANTYMKHCADLAYKNVSKSWFDLYKDTDPKNAEDREKRLVQLFAMRSTLSLRKSRPRYFDIGVKFDDLIEFRIWQAEADRLGIRIESEFLDRIFLLEFFGALRDYDLVAAQQAARQDNRDATEAYVRRAVAEEFRVKIAQYAVMTFQTQPYLARKFQGSGKFEMPDVYDETRTPITLAQLWDFYRAQRGEFTVSLIPVRVEDFAKGKVSTTKKIGEPDDIQRREFFDVHKNEPYDPSSDKWGLEIPPRIKVEYLIADPQSPAYIDVAKFIAKMNVASPEIPNPVAYPLMQWPGMLPLVAAYKHHADLEGYYEAMLSRNKVSRDDKYRGAALYYEPDCVSPILAHYASKHPQAIASLIGATVLSPAEGAGVAGWASGIPGFLAWGTVQSPLEGKVEERGDKEKTKVLTKLRTNDVELNAAIHSELQRRAPVYATVIASGLTGFPLDIAAPYLSMDTTVRTDLRIQDFRIPRYAYMHPFYTLETVQREIEAMLATRTAEEWAQQNILTMKRELEQAGGDVDKFRRELKKLQKDLNLVYGPPDEDKQTFHDRFSIADAPEFKVLKDAYIKSIDLINFYEGRDVSGRRLTAADFPRIFFDPTESFAIFAKFRPMPWPPEVKQSNARFVELMPASLKKGITPSQMEEFRQQQLSQDPNRPAPSLALYKTAPKPILFWKTAESNATRLSDYKQLTTELKRAGDERAKVETALAKDPKNGKLKSDLAKWKKDEADLLQIKDRIVEGWKFDRARNTEALPKAKEIAKLLIDRPAAVKEEAEKLQTAVITLEKLSQMHPEFYAGKGLDYTIPSLPEDKIVTHDYPREKMMEQILSLHGLKSPIEIGNKELDEINKELFEQAEKQKNPDRFVQILANKPRSIFYVAAITSPPKEERRPFVAALQGATFIEQQLDRPNTNRDLFVDRALMHDAAAWRKQFVEGLGQAHNFKLIDADARKAFDGDRGE